MTHSDGGEDRPSSEVVNAGDRMWDGDSENAGDNSFTATADSTKKSSKKGAKQTKILNQEVEEPSSYMSGPLLPSEVVYFVFNS